MSITATQLTARVSAEGISETKSALSDVGASATATGGIFRSALGGALSLASGVAGQALGILKDQFVDSVKIAMAHQQVMAQTAQAIKSTGGASGETAQAIDNLADSLSRTTDFSHDTIQSGENLLLTFTGIGKDVFPQVTSTMLDMAQAMGGDTKGAALQLGKALNDPATGLTALTRVGVTFSDQQKQQIKDMVAVGDTAGAQKVMLAELQKEFGGSAEAAGKTLPGALAILKNNFDDIKEKIGSAVIPVLASFAGFVSEKALPVLESFAGWFSTNLGPAVQRVGAFIQPVITAFSSLGNATNPVRETFENIGHVFGYVGAQFSYLFGTIQSIGIGVFHAFSDTLGITGGSIESKFLQAVGKVGPIIGQVGNVVHEFASKLGSIDFYSITQGIVQFGQSLGTQFGPLLKNIVSLLSGQFSVTLKDVGKDAQQVGSWFESSVVPAIQKVVPPFEGLAKTLLGTLVPAAIQVRGIVIDLVQHAFEKFAPIIERIVPPLIQFGGVMAGVVSNAIKFLTPYIVSAAKEIGVFASGLIDRLAPIATNVFNMISTAVGGFSKFWAAVWPTVSAILKGVWDEIQGIIQIAWSIVSGIINIGLDILGGNWKKAWEDVKAMLSGVWEGIKKYLSGAWEVIKAIFSPVAKWFTDRFNDARNGITGAFSSIGKWFGDRLHDIQGAFGGIGGWFHDRGVDAWNSITGVFSGIGGWFHDRWTDVTNSFSDVIGGLKDTASTLWSEVSSPVKGAFNNIITLINNVIGDIDAISVDTPLGHVGFSIPKIPYLATGGFITSPGMAIVGERGPEGVILPAGAQVIPNSQLGQMSTPPQIIVQSPPIYLDGRLVAGGLMPYITNDIRYATGARI